MIGWSWAQFINDRHTVAVWHFNEGEGDTVYDSSGNGHHGLINGAVWDGLGISGSCLVFDGNDDYIEIPTTTDLIPQREMSLELWLKISNYPPVHYALISKADNYHGGSGYLWGIENNGRPKCYFKVSDWKFSTANLPLNAWAYLGVTVADGKLKYYINGCETDLFTFPSGDLVDNEFNLIIGRTENTNIYFLKGSLDEIRISNIARNSDEIKQNWLTYKRGAEASSILYLKNGDRISGTIIRPLKINMATDYGNLTIPFSDITNIVFGSKNHPDLAITSSSRISGRVAVDTFIILSGVGEINVPKNQISKIDR
jgi:hypothetical protein